MPGAVLDDVPRVDRRGAALVAQQITEPREVLDAVAVRVDDRVIEPGPDLGGGRRHVTQPAGSSLRPPVAHHDAVSRSPSTLPRGCISSYTRL